ncbi:MAG TPA: cytochrome C oxidase subunit IV family protein [Bryobacteraceae bacterium]|nr:cytochrome C oxidase subunit IV family protein [Bryobacteraceae bacterium]
MSGHAHTPSARIYVVTLGALLFLTGITVGAAYINFGSSSINLIIAVLIATVKASLVAMIFMHLRHDPPVNAIIFISSLLFLGLFILFPMIDIGSRDKVVPYGLRMQNPPPAAAGQAPAPGAPAASGEHGAAPAASH